MIKLIHTADVHLDSPLKTLALRDPELRERLHSASRQAFTTLVDHACDEQAAALLISGDLFDGAQRSAKTAAFLLAELDRLRERGIAVYYIKGNHDAENPVTGSLVLPDNVHEFSGRGGKHQLGETDVWIHGVSFSARQAPHSLLDKFPAPVPNAINIAMLHTSLAGSAGHDVYAPCSVENLKGLGFDYWALGHIHKRQVHSQSPWIVMPGIPQGRDMGEPGMKSATLLTLEQGQISTAELPTSSIEFIECNVDVSGVDSADALRQLIRNRFRVLADALDSPNAVVRVRLSGESTLRWQLIRDSQVWSETVSALAGETGTLWLEKLKIDLDEHSKPVSDGHAVQELAALMNDIREDAAFQAQAAQEIDALLAQLPTAQRAKLLQDESSMDALVEQLAREGADHLMAVMYGHPA